MATKRTRKPAKPSPDVEEEEGLSEEEAEALAGAPAEGEDEMPPLDIEQLTPFPQVDASEMKRPFAGQELELDYPDELEPLGIRDDSVSKARDASDIMREANANLLLHRVEPSEYRGLRTRGFIRKFHAPFSIEEAQVWAAENRGGGKYRFWIYDGGGVIRGGSTFEIAGNPKTPEEIVASENATATKTKGRGDGDRDRERDLERQLGDERMDRMMQMMTQQRREDQAENRRMMEKLAEAAAKPERNTAKDWAPLLAALSPILIKVLEKPDPPPPPADHFKDMAILQERFQTEMMRLTRDQIDNKSKPDRHEAMMTKMMETVMQKAMGIGQHDPMSGINMALDKVLPTLISKITNIALDKAAGGGKEEERDLSPRFIAEKVAELVKDTTEKFANRNQPQAPPPGYGPPPQGYPPMLPPPGTAAGQPSTPVDGWPMTGPPTAEEVPPQQMAHDAMHGPPPGAAPPTETPPGQPQSIMIPPGQTWNGITNTGTDPIYVDPNTPAPTVAAPVAPAPAPAVAPDAPPAPGTAPSGEEPPHVHPDIFAKAIEMLNSGQTGEDLAVWTDEHNDGNKLLSKVAIEYLENTAPFYLVGYIIEAAPPDLAPAFENPAAKQLVSDFCDFFYNSEDGPEEPEAPADATAPAPAPTPAPTPEAAAPPASPESETPDAG